MSDKEKEIIEKIAEGLPHLSEFDKGYFLGVVEAKADKRVQSAAEQLELAVKQEGGGRKMKLTQVMAEQEYRIKRIEKRQKFISSVLVIITLIVLLGNTIHQTFDQDN